MKLTHNNPYTKKILQFLVILFIAGSWLLFEGCQEQQSNSDVRRKQNQFTDLSVFEKAFQNHQNNLQVTQQGQVIKILPDDTKGSQHQRFLVKLSSGHTLLVAHNIDLAPKVPGLQTGETIIFHGEYEWNDKGGVIHWTHHDPDGRHEDGWLEYQGKKYQ